MATIKQIAKKAGVSTATVSRILNGKGGASPATVQRVNRVVSELNYQPNGLAKVLSERSSNFIAVILPNLMNPFFGELTTALEHEAQRRGVQLLVCNSNDRRERVEQLLEFAIDHYALGAVINTMQVTARDLEQLAAAGVHPVTVDRSDFEHPYSSVNVDQEEGFAQATRFLMERGARQIALISVADLSISRSREAGYLRSLEGLGADPSVLYGDFSMESGYQAVREHLLENPTLDGILASNDLMAIGALRACREFGRAVPRHVKVIGNDDLGFDEFTHPRLTTLSQRREEVSRMVIEEIIRLQDDESAPAKALIQPELIVRETT